MSKQRTFDPLAVDCQVTCPYLSEKHDGGDARRFLQPRSRARSNSIEVTTDRDGQQMRVLDEPVPAAADVFEQYRNSRSKRMFGLRKSWFTRATHVGVVSRKRLRQYTAATPPST
jgi:hypothetical protein